MHDFTTLRVGKNVRWILNNINIILGWFCIFMFEDTETKGLHLFFYRSHSKISSNRVTNIGVIWKTGSLII